MATLPPATAATAASAAPRTLRWIALGLLLCAAAVIWGNDRLSSALARPESVDEQVVVQLATVPPLINLSPVAQTQPPATRAPSATEAGNKTAVHSGRVPPLVGETPYDGAMFYTSRERLLAAGVNSSWNFTLIGGWPVCEFHTLCMYNHLNYPRSNGFRGGLFGSAEPHRLETFNHPQAYTCVASERHNRAAYDEGIGMNYFKHEHFPAGETVVWLPGTTVVIDTFLTKGHFGHVIARALQTRGLIESMTLQGAAPERVFWFRQSRYPSSRRPASWPLTALVVKLMGEKYTARNASAYGRPDLHDSWKWACMERAIDVRDVFERTFASKEELVRWHAFRKEWNPSGEFDDAKCPRDAVVVLQREDGRGDRSMRNQGAMTDAMRAMGICAYVNGSVGSNTPVSAQARLFETYGLLISAHSSQLRNVIWSHPLSATLEIRQTYEVAHKNVEWRRGVSPFCTGAMCPTIYATTAGHGSQGLTGPVDVDVPKFTAALRALLDKQKMALVEAGCALPAYLSGAPCA